MSFFDGALTFGSNLLGAAVEDSPFETVADAGELVSAGANMWHDGPSWGGAAEVGSSGLKLGADLLADSGKFSLLEDLMPGVGPLVGGLASTVGGVGGMCANTDQIDQGYLENDEGGRNEFWGSAGDATLGGMHAALGGAATLGLAADAAEAGSIIGLPLELLSLPATATAIGADALLSGLETGVNTVGLGVGVGGSIMNQLEGREGDQAHDWYFGAGDVVGLAEHGVVDGASALFDYLAD